MLAGGAAFALLSPGLSDWDLWPLLVIAGYALASDLLPVPSTVSKIDLSGSPVAIVLAAALYGAAPAAAICALGMGAGWVRAREPGLIFRQNLVTGLWYPMLTAIAFHAATRALGVRAGDTAFVLFAFPAALLASMLNLWMVAVGMRLTRGTPVARTMIELVAPVLAAELFSAVLTVLAVLVTVRLHLLGLIVLGVFLAIFQYLLGELVTSRHRHERLRTMATTDELTGLTNRRRFRERVEHRIADAGEALCFAVLLMDLDRFKEVNDTLGHTYGDRLLRDLGPRLVEAAGEGILVARLGGDEFGVLLPRGCASRAEVTPIAERLLRTAAQPFAIDELTIEIGASVGVARFPDDGRDANALLRSADVAMYAAKEAQTGVKFYTAEQNQHTKRRLSVLSDIRRALSRDEIVVHYQPIVDLEDRIVTGAEGLVRWEHPEHGLIPPGAFVQSVEQSVLIGPLTRHVLEHSIAECARWRREGRDMSVAVNLSVRNLLDRDLPREISRLLAAYQVPPASLQLEITESMIMTDPERALATVGRLSELGVRLSVDDFGTGYSSLANLRRLPIDDLKIDRSFVSPMLEDESDLIIVRSTINLGHDLGLRIIAEGVEDSATLEHLASLGCDLAQGYHLSRPLAAAAFGRWLADTPRQPGVGELPPAPAPATSAPVVAPRPERVAPKIWTPSGLIVASPDA
ncbi:MAG TPA: EAL domain-containing protein [Solirubrobacteraceae bacterium]|nr:EAL domain-containing protein [Solirubrobacteraceae bacterium]